VTGFNGWDSATHDHASSTTLVGTGLRLRLEYANEQTAITMTDTAAPPGRRCVCIRTDRSTGSVYIGTGPTQRAAGEAALAAMTADSVSHETR
jgi:hypothetical protein